MSNRTRKNKHKNKKNGGDAVTDLIQHHHFLLRMETLKCPSADDKDMASTLISRILYDIKMKPLDKPHVYYVTEPRYNEGLTAICPIQTSHIAFHFWKNPEPKILNNSESKCLLQFDIYTCGKLTLNDIHNVLHHLTAFGPTHVNATLINRNYSMTVDRHMRWDKDEQEWTQWIHRIPSM
jgi:S-adenosylmethionine/arginine decarboxylase-like enzyme